ncbi:acyl-CoA dehydratase activase [Anaerotignum sp. MB30-C6]|uniref:acyl-CoA dehydratase activase n=1 Tax=Anaerotignum sp. MB30-C6 TaxID=3070814 RepID=UPI0027DC9FE1|nr:acyl-CoA dehydratase activase [Anaerotignum sp. MB30-C6]WMI80063.1 acyl-CoA dehydratase activase [Anaerotignum sp. MB30-C6]
MYSIGIDIGYSSVKVILTDEGNSIRFSRYQMHRGRIKSTLLIILKEVVDAYNLEEIIFGAVTGNGTKFLRADSEIKAVNDVTAVIEGAMAENKEVGSIIDIGGESARFITGLSEKDKSRIEISMNSNCSSGTGSFLEEQMSRLNLKLTDYSKLAKKAKSIPRIAGRCSVFAKTDITHHQQEGVPAEDILLGLAYALVRNYKGTVMKKLPVTKPILFSGGVAYNGAILTAFKDVLALSQGELIFPQNLGGVGAFGAAVISRKEGLTINMEKLISLSEGGDESMSQEDGIILPKLSAYGVADSANKHVCKDICKETESIDCYLGIDIGSTSTNLVLINTNSEIISFKYLRTKGNPVNAVQKGLQQIKEEFGERIRMIGAGTTGSGRYLIGKMIGADVIKDEITAQAKAAVQMDGEVDTIFEIGGQDSKFISIENGGVVDFQMNKICAAGTGSFIEEQAKKFDIPIESFGQIALGSEAPISLGERCTVFIESSIASCLAKGAKLEDIVSGLCYSIVKNYLDRVVGQKKIGNKIFFQGGLAYNQGVINAFKAITGKEIIVPPFFSVTGAYGVAVLAMEEVSGKGTTFKGFDFSTDVLPTESLAKNKRREKENEFNESVEKMVFFDYKPEISNKKTVGIPRALFTYGMFSMFHGFFKELDLNVILSEPTDESVITLGQEYAMDETCYPIKLITGHVASLMKKKVDYIFFPDLVTVDHPGSQSRKNYGCAFMQLAFKVMNRAMELDKKGIVLLSPSITFHMGKESIMQSFLKIGEQLGKSPQQTRVAVEKGLEAALRFEDRMEENSKIVESQLKPDEIAFVLVSKIYGVADPVLNMAIPEKLAGMGYKVLPFYDLPEGDSSKEHPNMFWPFGQHILEPAQLIREHPNLYAIFLTHHGCGPDSIFSHYFREEMQGKPYLHIEIDEHSSGVGIITRVEAFINSLKNIEIKPALTMQTYQDSIAHKETNIMVSLEDLKERKTVYLPYLYPYSTIFQEVLRQRGIIAKTLPPSSKVSIETGRKFTITEEYFSLTALLGNVFTVLKNLDKEEVNQCAFLIPQNEGTETDGQYSRLLRTKLDEEGFEKVDIVSPYWEDVLCQDNKRFEETCLTFLAGDIIWCAPQNSREMYLKAVMELIKHNQFHLEQLKALAASIATELKGDCFEKTILAVGEINILFDELLNNEIFKELEKKGYRILYSPFAEAIWMMWWDYANQNKNAQSTLMEQRLKELKSSILTISKALSNWSPYEKDINELVRIGDKTLGYFSGAHGRYRQGKQLCASHKIDGVITAASIYENTGIVLGMLQKGFEEENTRPVLNLTFDGNKNENDLIKVDSFIYYL